MTSAVVAVIFAALAFVNLVTFRIVFGQRAPLLAWAAAVFVVGVGCCRGRDRLVVIWRARSPALGLTF